MKRRGFLGALLAVPIAAKAALAAPKKTWYFLNHKTWHPTKSIPLESVGFEDITAELKRAYPPGAFDAAVEERSPFLRYLKGSANLENQMPKANSIITDLRDPEMIDEASDEDWEGLDDEDS